MEELVIRSRANKDFKLPYTEHTPFPVKAGPGRIVKGQLRRLPGDRAYAAAESIAHNPDAVVTFNNVTRFANNGSGVIIGGKATKNTANVLNVGFRIWLYQSPFNLTAQGEDGGEFSIRWGRRDTRIGYLDFENFVMGTQCAESQGLIGLGQSLLFGMQEGNSLYGLVQTKRPYEAKSEEEIDFYLHISQD